MPITSGEPIEDKLDNTRASIHQKTHELHEQAENKSEDAKRFVKDKAHSMGDSFDELKDRLGQLEEKAEEKLGVLRHRIHQLGKDAQERMTHFKLKLEERLDHLKSKANKAKEQTADYDASSTKSVGHTGSFGENVEREVLVLIEELKSIAHKAEERLRELDDGYGEKKVQPVDMMDTSGEESEKKQPTSSLKSALKEQVDILADRLNHIVAKAEEHLEDLELKADDHPHPFPPPIVTTSNMVEESSQTNHQQSQHHQQLLGVELGDMSGGDVSTEEEISDVSGERQRIGHEIDGKKVRGPG